ncbi:MAG: competence/damage-inducible protein A [Ignavibacteriaceae bacterium]
MKAQIITIGDEILIGQTLNTNAAYIGEKLAGLGIEIIKSSVVPDSEQNVLDEFTAAWKKCDLIIVTGGLGPTHDDITKDCVVKFFKTKLVKNEDVLDSIKALFLKRKRKLTRVNEDQALIPEISEPIINRYGTAPGIFIEKENKLFFVLPGVPYEMKAMMEDFILPKLEEKTTIEGNVTLRKILQTTGIPESTLYERLGNIDELLNGAQLAFLPGIYGVKLRITVKDDDEEKAKNKLSEIEQKIRSLAGRYIFGSGEETLEEVVGRLLKERSLTIAVAESCTGGNVANLLTNVSGSSEYFERGIVAYSNAAKVEILKVDEDLIAEHGAVSLEVARQMAEGVKSTSGTDIGLSLTGIMGPAGGSPDKPVGLVYIGYCDEKLCTAKKFVFGDNRLLNKQRTSLAALDYLRRHLLGISDED